MPFRSQAQRAYMYKNLPDIAEKWEKETNSGTLPKRINPKKKGPSIISQRRRRRKVLKYNNR
tara:strand:- start:314 stop:499 length:186 start_codon:yes stop_codon:yes gene_type:complete